MAGKKYALGIDASTQSLTGVVVDIDAAQVVVEHSIQYARDPRLAGYGIDPATMLLPPWEPGAAEQPPLLFVAALEALLDDLTSRGTDLAAIRAVNVSAQQHGHVYLAKDAVISFARLSTASAGPLASLIDGAFSYPRAPIWKTANTAEDAQALRQAAGGAEGIIRLTGSDSPLRFSGAAVRRIFAAFPDVAAKTGNVQLLSNFMSAVLSGNPEVGVDFGNASGTSLMNYSTRSWDRGLLAAAGIRAEQLPEIVHPLARVGTIAPWFTAKYGIPADAAVIAGSGDNPQSKVLIETDLLSLGTSYVFMTNAGIDDRDMMGWSNSMYDGLGRPFIFACRTNGALVQDRTRTAHGLKVTDFAASDAALAAVPAGKAVRIWQPDTESFPLSRAGDMLRADDLPKGFEADYAGVVDSSLALLHYFSRETSSSTSKDALFITGGPSASALVRQRIADIWNRPVRVLSASGAGLGAAVAAAVALVPEKEREAEAGRLRAKLSETRGEVLPNAATHERLEREYKPRLLELFAKLS